MRNSFRRILLYVALLAGCAVTCLLLIHVRGHRDFFPSSKPPYVISHYAMRLERTACFGTCPTFDLSIDTDGKTLLTMPASFPIASGRASEMHEIEFRGEVGHEQRRRLIATLEKGRFWALKSNYSRMVTDNPSTRIEVRTPERRWSVNVYAVPCQSDRWDPIGDKSVERVPDVFCGLAEQLDAVACETYGQGVKSSLDNQLVPIWPPHCESTP